MLAPGNKRLLSLKKSMVLSGILHSWGGWNWIRRRRKEGQLHYRPDARTFSDMTLLRDFFTTSTFLSHFGSSLRWKKDVESTVFDSNRQKVFSSCFTRKTCVFLTTKFWDKNNYLLIQILKKQNNDLIHCYGHYIHLNLSFIKS